MLWEGLCGVSGALECLHCLRMCLSNGHYMLGVGLEVGLCLGAEGH